MKLIKLLKITLIFLPIVISTLLCLKSLSKTDFTIDEYNYLQNSYDLVRQLKWDTQLIRNHPPLMFYLHGIPSLFIHSNNPWVMLNYARLTNILILVILAIVVYLITNKYYGFKAGIFSLILLCFNPEILAHARLITFDLALAFFIFIYIVFFSTFLINDNNKFRSILLLGVIFGFTLSTKYNAIILIPLSFIICCVYGFFIKRKFFLRKIIQYLQSLLIAFFIVNLVYAFQGSLKIPQIFYSKQFQSINNNLILRNLLYVLPEPYLQGADWQLNESQKLWYWNFFKQQKSQKAFLDFYSLTFIYKTPIPLLVLIIIAFGLMIFKKYSKSVLLDIILLIIIGYFFLHFSFFNNLNIGFRYLLFIYPLLIFFVAKTVAYNFQNNKINITYKLILGFLIVWNIFSLLKIHPYYLAYANELIGGPKNAWKYWSDSTLDWGQDNKDALNYLNQHTDIIVNPRKLMLGKIAVSVADMTYGGYYEDYEWLRNLKKDPIDNIGYTWLIFDIKKENFNKINK